MNQIQQAGVTLNTDKWEFWRDELTFLGRVVSMRGISDGLADIIIPDIRTSSRITAAF